jgi:transposase
MESITRVGIDASKDRLEVFIDRPSNRRHVFNNDERGVDKLKRELGQGNYVVAIEATGRYESLVRHALEAAGYTVKLQNPRQVRRLAEGMGTSCKTDKVDAKVLAETATLCAPNEPRSKEREALADVSRTIESLKREKSNHLKRIQVPGFSKVAIKSLKCVIAALNTQIQKLEREFVALVKTSSFAEKYRIALTVPSIGPVMARAAVCELPENLHGWSVRQISTYAGVAPVDESSGTKTLPSRVPKHKNVHLKAALYMPALNAVQTQEWARKTYARLMARGLKHQQAMIPIMHKLLFHLVAVLKRGSAWEAEPPKKT